ncbi:hypothetical protein AYI70_g2912 [Smittium culicis]|uniref:DUF4246 domain-containing protein n=1 Tax=Smittium culicis TaxID=133412 RepID=A0A1R1Y5W1_9FUNG|nr:hypothetical protein AYI70_g2912 [Smittium culicis]
MAYKKIKDRFKSPYSGISYECLNLSVTQAELDVISVLCKIKNKINWEQEIKSPKARTKLFNELSEEFSENSIQFAFDELRYYIRKGRSEGILPGPVDKTYTSDSIIPENLQECLINQVKKLENVPDNELNWRPSSNKQILDLVDPLLYPLVLGETRAISNCVDPCEVIDWKSVIGSGKVCNLMIEPKTLEVYDYHNLWDQYLDSAYFYHKYQWLPAEIKVNSKGKAKILSYINNLHPDIHKDLYTTIEDIFGRFIPIIQKSLTDTALYNNELDWGRVSYNDLPVESFNEYAFRQCAKRGLLTEEQKKYIEKNGIENAIPSDACKELLSENYEMFKKRKPPTGLKFDPRKIPTGIKKIGLKNTRLQVVVKLENIVLTPSNSKYEGGVWSVDGIKDEFIISSAIYYYDKENVTESQLDFRTITTNPSLSLGGEVSAGNIVNLCFYI